MEIKKTNIEGVVIIAPTIYKDDNGFTYEEWNQKEFNEKVTPIEFVQDNESKSEYGVVRGLHFQKGDSAQAKLVRVTDGKILDIAVDIRKGSPTYGQHVAVELSRENKEMLFLPKGFAHGFITLSEIAVVQYKCDNYYDPSSEGGISFLDPALGIVWPIEADKILLSEKDKKHPELKDFESSFIY